MSRTPRKTAAFGKRSNSMRRNPKAEVTKRGWMYKQASSGVKQWNKRWFVLTDRCLFYYKDEKEDGVLGSLPLLSFRIGAVEPVDNITRRFAFKVWSEEEEEEEEGQDGQLKAPVVSCLQAKHAGTRTYYFSADSHEDQQDWIRTMREAAEVTEQTHRIKLDTADDLKTTGTTRTDPQTQTHNGPDGDPPHNPKMNGVGCPDTSPLTTPSSDHEAKRSIRRRGDVAEADKSEGGMPAGTVPHSNHHPDGWGTGGPPHSKSQTSNGNPPVFGKYSEGQGQREVGGGQSHDHKDPQENVVLRRGFVPRTTPERVAQRKSSMAQLQQWVNQRRVMNSQEDLNSPSHYYSVHRGVSADFYRHSVGSQYGDEYPLYQPGVRPDSICSVSAVGGYDPHWTVERRSLRDGPPQPRDPWGPQQYAGMEKSMRRLSIQPRSRSVPRSPSLSSGGHYSPVPPNFASPARSPSTYFDRFSGRMRDDVIYADPFAYSLRRSISSPKYVYPGDRRSFSHGLYQHSYPVSPSIHMKADEILDLQLQRNLEYLDQQIPPFHDVYSRELHPTLKLNEIETSKLLGRLCEQSRILRDHEAVVHRLRMEKDSLEEELVAIHQEMELYQNQPSILENLQFKKETQQNQLINIRGELSQASSALATVRMEFDALEDEAHAIHGDLWEQLNAGGQSELVRRHIQKEFWRVQDVLEGLHKSNSSRGTDTAKHRVTSGASGSFSTNSPASPLSSVSLTSPLSPFSPVPGCQASPTKPLGPEVSTGHTQPGGPTSPKLGLGPFSQSRASPEVCRRLSFQPRPKSCLVPRAKNHWEPDLIPPAELINYYYYASETSEGTCPTPTLPFQVLKTSVGTWDPVVEETDRSLIRRLSSKLGQHSDGDKVRAGEQSRLLPVPCQDSRHINPSSESAQTYSDVQAVRWLTSNGGSRELQFAVRKDAGPELCPATISPDYLDSCRAVSSNRRWSLPESQTLHLQDPCQTDVFSFHCSSGLYGPSVSLSQSLGHSGRGARPLTDPHGQGQLSVEPVTCVMKEPSSPSNHSRKAFRQTHF